LYNFKPKSAAPVLPAFLRDANLFHNTSRDDDYQYVDTRGFCHSPTMFVKLLLPDKTAELIQILKANWLEDRCYAESGPQPNGWIGLSPSLKAAVLDQKEADWKVAETIRRTNGQPKRT